MNNRLVSWQHIYQAIHKSTCQLDSCGCNCGRELDVPFVITELVLFSVSLDVLSAAAESLICTFVCICCVRQGSDWLVYSVVVLI
jgi:hypothetical protein